MNATMYRMPHREDALLFRMPRWVAILLVYLSFCLAGVFGMRSSLMRSAITMPDLFFGFVAGESVRVHWSVYLLGGVLDAVWFELLLHLFVNMVRAKLPHVDGPNTRLVIRVFFVFRNLSIAALDTVLFWHPVATGMILYFADFMITTAWCAGFCVYFSSRHLPRFLVGQNLALMSRYYFGYHLLVVLLYLLMGISL